VTGRAVAGTNRKAQAVLGGPAVVLVRPQMGENIGAAARAMLNFGLTELRLVAPRDGWPNPAAVAMASGADRIVAEATVFPSLEAALADRVYVAATSARPRELEKRVLEPEAAGLTTEEAALADLLITIPTNPAFASLNLAQAVLILGYAWFNARPRADGMMRDIAEPATKAELFGMFEHLERELDRLGFLHPPEKKPAMMRNIKTMRTFRGIIAALTGAKVKR